MEKVVTINEMLPDEITKLNSSLICPRLKDLQDNTPSYRAIVQETLSKLIDQLGEQSAQAQGLFKVITTAEKLRNSTHYLYLLKDANARGGKGELIGLLKIGHKNLFLFDEEHKVYELEPLCILDFFISPSHQRRGYGRMLFDYMLNDTNTRVQDLAIDGPSPKMEHFLRKSYGIDRLLRQNNNFAVAPEFFANAKASSKSGRSTPLEARNVGRYAAHKPRSCIGKIIHGDEALYDNSNGEANVSQDGHKEVEVELVPEAPVPVPEVEPEVEPEQSSARPCSLGVEPMTPLPLSIIPARLTPEPQLVADTPAGVATPRDPSDPTQLTKRGHFDVKFYHNKLW